MKKSPSRSRLLLIALVVVLLLFGALMLRMVRMAPPAPEPEIQAVQEEPQFREVRLYFGTTDGEHLDAETAEIEDCLEEEDCIKATVQTLVNGPSGDLVPILPAQTEVRGVSVDGGTAVVDFSRNLVAAHPGGSSSELLTVYGLANTLAENFPHIRQVRILVEGEAVESIKGHVDLSGPVQADFSFSRQSDAIAGEIKKAEAGGEGLAPPVLPGRGE